MKYFIFIQTLIAQFANNGYPDQTRVTAASDLGLHCLHMSHKKDLGLHCLHMSHKKDASIKWANTNP